MKQLQLELNKRLLIVEFDDKEHLENVISCDKQGVRFCSDDDEPTKLICKGDELTEDIAKGFLHQSLHTGLFAHYVKDIPVNTYCYKTALEAFDAVIYAYGYHWGEKPEPSHYDYQNDDCETDFTQYYLEHEKWEKYQSRTFNPSKCIIFEII
ncbi:hypothetical protein [Chryseobacterium indologenes]|uniref:hypothetical protein n=1 Tax=Chryseobacterium indologenes TaxID=253 RepID=UPI0009A13F69|nr:hypothetical protein [Chryseobacterium indologenes]